MAYIENKENIFENYVVQGDTTLKSGKKQKNPRLFKFDTKAGKNKGTGYSIKAKKVEGLGKKHFIEIACYGAAMAEAKSLKFKKGDRLTCCGFYEVKEGKTQNFNKVSINDEMQIEHFVKRPVKHNEL